ncbi:hypothetical protein [Vibrio owensii]|uniref:hypothetical protein n=1 Tax=Vibrio owensii TaxID=696485 RepID=UPI00406764F2
MSKYDMAKSVNERKTAQRERDKALGFKEINLRIHKDDEKSVKDYAKALLEKRLKLMQCNLKS